jgi:hypothetical protein
MVIPLAGCMPEQTKDMEACRADAERFFSMYKVVDPADPSSQFVIGCMAAKGYDFTVAATDCDGRYPLSTQATCYVPNSWARWALHKIRHARDANRSDQTTSP